VTGTPGPKRTYRPGAAKTKAEEHAEHFVAQRAAALRGQPSDAILVAPYDAELFGHWWYEGPLFLEHVLRQIARRDDMQAVTLSRALAQHHAIDGAPTASSWGRGGFGEPWMNERNAELWRPLHHRHRKVVTALAKVPSTPTHLGHAARELLQLEASDWPFLIDQGSAAHYARERLARHLQNIDALVDTKASRRGELRPLLEALDDATLSGALTGRS
jgi:1,4-alpha-glucan branching enzyme